MGNNNGVTVQMKEGCKPREMNELAYDVSEKSMGEVGGEKCFRGTFDEDKFQDVPGFLTLF